MKSPPFTYHRPDSLTEALELFAEFGDDAKVLAGGQSLLPVMALRLGRPDHIIDLNRIPGLAGIEVSAAGVSIGALVRHAQAERSAELAKAAPLVHATMPHIGHRAIRSQGTLCGSIAHADPAAEMPAVCLAVGATMVAASTQGTREIRAAEFAQGYLTTALAPTEILIETRFPPWSPTAGGAIVEVSRRHGDYALVGLASVIDAPDGTVSSAALAFFGVANTAVRVPRVEKFLIGKEIDDSEAFAAAADQVAATIEPNADVHATANYRRHLAGVLTRKGLAAAATKIGGLA